MDCKYKVNIKNIQYNYKVILSELQGKYKFKLFCTGGKYDDTEIKEEIASLEEENEYLNSIVNQLPKVTGSGTTLSLSPTIKGKMKVDLKGNTYQYTTTGTQQFDYDTADTKGTITKITNGYNKTATGSWKSGGVWFSLKANTAYTFKCLYNQKGTQTTTGISIRENGGGALIETGKSAVSGTYVLTFTTNSITDIIIYFYSNFTNNSLPSNCDFTYVQIVEGTYTEQTMPEYEPYTNGASPNPDYPQDIQVVSGDNTIKVEGKNLLSVNNETFTREKAFDINTIPAGTYTFTCNCTSTDTDASQCVIIFQNGSTNVLAKALNRNTNVSMSITLNDEINKIDLYASDTWVHGEGDTATFTNMMVSTSGGEYQPYQSTTYPINLPNGMEMCWIPDTDYQDEMFKNEEGHPLYNSSLVNGGWYKYGEICKVVFNGSENDWSLDLTGTNTYRFRIDENTLANAQSGFCNNNQWVTSGFSGDNQLIGKLNNKLYYRINKSIVDVQTGNTTVNQFKTWLSNNNIICCSLLATPTYTQITDTTLISQLEALKEAESYLGQTNISQVNNDAPFIINASALYDLNNLITRVAILETE